MTAAARPGFPSSYVGRFAPSPTGPLHFGSIVAAVASFLDARASGGRWLVRIEDIDPPREVAGASDAILATLERWGLHWDDSVLFQSTRVAAYRAIAEQLLSQGDAFRCVCTRRELARRDEAVYPGICRQQAVAQHVPHALRVHSGDGLVAFGDALQGQQQWNLATEIGDFVIWRRDGLCSYQLAVTIDDGYQGITHVVRGIDLIDSTARQLHLRTLLGMPAPAFAHFAVAVDASGQKLSKQSGATPIDDITPRTGLFLALQFLHLQPPESLAGARVAELLQWGVEHWSPARLRGIAAIEVDAAYQAVARQSTDAAPRQA